MKALSVRQPWAFAIARMEKRFENRDWRTVDSALPKTLAIHASKGMTRNEYDDFMCFIHDNFAEKSLFVGGAVSQTGVSLHTLGFPNFKNMVRGAVIAVARPLRWVDESKSKWFVGKYAIEFADDVIALPQPVPCVGRLGFFELPDDIAQEVEKQITVR